jgi:hypothetical protein
MENGFVIQNITVVQNEPFAYSQMKLFNSSSRMDTPYVVVRLEKTFSLLLMKTHLALGFD